MKYLKLCGLFSVFHVCFIIRFLANSRIASFCEVNEISSISVHRFSKFQFHLKGSSSQTVLKQILDIKFKRIIIENTLDFVVSPITILS